MTGAHAKQPPTKIMKHAPHCAVDGCERPYYAKLHCRLHWERMYSTGNTARSNASPDMPVKDRLALHSKRAGECIEWTGHRDKDGYGDITINRTMLRAHRAAYDVHKGPIPSGLLVRHTCDNPPCINPDHLLVGTNADNMVDRSERGRAPRGAGNPAAKLTDSEVIKIRQFRAEGATYRELAARFGVGESTIGRVVKRTHWKHVKEAA